MLDIFSCVVQGLIPWGAQALLLGSIFALSPILVVSMSFYPMALALAAIVAVFLKHQMGAVAPAPTVPDARPQGPPGWRPRHQLFIPSAPC